MTEQTAVGEKTAASLPTSSNDQPSSGIALPLDTGLLTEQCLGNSTFAISLLGEFEKTAQDRTVAIEAQLRLGNLAKIAEIAHSLAGVAAILAAEPLSQVACRLQRTAEENDVPQTNDLIRRLREETNRLLEYIPLVRAKAEQNLKASAGVSTAGTVSPEG